MSNSYNTILNELNNCNSLSTGDPTEAINNLKTQGIEADEVEKIFIIEYYKLNCSDWC